jgi:DNA-binding MarR family transcriptional regulator
MAQLYGVGVWRKSIAIKDLAVLLGMDSTTMVRALKPLEKNGWVASEPDVNDRRSRLVSLSNAGESKLAEATPHWQAAQAELRAQVGNEATIALDGLLELAGDRVRVPRQVA